MASYLKTYSPQAVRVAYGGFPITGFADGEFLNITLNSDLTDEVIGAQGDVAITKIANYTATITLTLLQNAESNIYLMGMYSAMQRADDIARANMTIRDPSGSMLYECRDVHIKRATDVVLADGQNSKQWTLFCSNIVAVGGNSEIVNALGIASQVNAALDLVGLGV